VPFDSYSRYILSHVGRVIRRARIWYRVRAPYNRVVPLTTSRNNKSSIIRPSTSLCDYKTYGKIQSVYMLHTYEYVEPSIDMWIVVGVFDIQDSKTWKVYEENDKIAWYVKHRYDYGPNLATPGRPSP
jgi:hypothetical protein